MIDLPSRQQRPRPAIRDDLGSGTPADWALWEAEATPPRQPWLLISAVVLLLVGLGTGTGLMVLRTLPDDDVVVRTGHSGLTHVSLRR